MTRNNNNNNNDDDDDKDRQIDWWCPRFRIQTPTYIYRACVEWDRIGEQ